METIIVGTDFSAPATNAVNYAVELAKFFSAKLVLVNSFSLPVGGYDSLAPLDMIASLQDSSSQALEQLKTKIIKDNYDFAIVCISLVGSPSSVIIETANRYSADLVVMGMTGEGGFLKRHVIGSAALSLAHKSNLPLFIVPENGTYRRIHQICFACDPTHIEETTLLTTTKYFASVFDAEVELVTVKPNKEMNPEKTDTYSFVEKRLQNTRHKTVFIKDNNTSQALEYYFKFHKTDLVMVNPRKHSFFETLFSESVTKHLAFSIDVPLLIIH